MSYLDDVEQKVKGKVQQVQGDMQGGAKGGVQKLKGKVNETIADVKLKARDEKAKQRTRNDDL